MQYKASSLLHVSSWLSFPPIMSFLKKFLPSLNNRALFSTKNAPLVPRFFEKTNMFYLFLAYDHFIGICKEKDIETSFDYKTKEWSLSSFTLSSSLATALQTGLCIHITRDLVHTQILTPWASSGAWDSTFLTSFWEMPVLLAQLPHVM